VLQHLKDKAQTAEAEGRRSPITYPCDPTTGQRLQMDMIRSIQDRQNGASVGFHELQRLLDWRQAELEDQIKQQDNKQRDTQ